MKGFAKVWNVDLKSNLEKIPAFKDYVIENVSNILYKNRTNPFIPSENSFYDKNSFLDINKEIQNDKGIRSTVAENSFTFCLQTSASKQFHSKNKLKLHLPLQINCKDSFSVIQKEVFKKLASKGFLKEKKKAKIDTLKSAFPYGKEKINGLRKGKILKRRLECVFCYKSGYKLIQLINSLNTNNRIYGLKKYWKGLKSEQLWIFRKREYKFNKLAMIHDITESTDISGKPKKK